MKAEETGAFQKQAKTKPYKENRKSRKKSVFPVFLLTFYIRGDMVNHTSNEPYK